MPKRIVISKILRSKDITLPCMQRNLVIPNAAASSSIEITEIDLGSAVIIQQCFHCSIKLHAI